MGIKSPLYKAAHAHKVRLETIQYCSIVSYK